ncbi:MAG: hypothetical protein IJP48_11790 [Synergistaceae bacterium]|nr:hypothetical protein [Synergistaceae bacterium]
MTYTITFNGSTISFNAKSQKDAELIKRAINEVLTMNGFVNLDVEDVQAVTDGAEFLTVCEGTGEGDNRAEDSARDALKNMDITSAKKILIAVITGTEITLTEISGAAFTIEESCSPDAQVVWGHALDESVGDKVKTILIAAY